MPSAPQDAAARGRETTGPPTPYPPYPFFMPQEEDEINLLDLSRTLWKRKSLIFLVTLLGTSAAAAYALLATPIYRAQAVIAPPAEKQAGGISAAIGAFGGLGAEIAGSMGISLGGTDANRIEALLKSRRVASRVVAKNNLLPILFEDDWNSEKQAWTVSDPDDIPTFWDAEEELEKIYIVKNDTKAGVLQVAFDWQDMEVAEQVLRSFLTELALVVQEDELRKIETNRKFVAEQLESASDPVIVAKLQALLSEQIEKAMMARNVEEFAYELIDPPAASDERVRPKRALLCVLGLTASAFLGIFFAFFLDWLQSARETSQPDGS